MSGIWGKQGLIDYALGFDDDAPKSTEDQRVVYYFHFDSHRARPGLILQLRGPRPTIRKPANEGEYQVVKIVESVFKRMMGQENQE